MEVVVEQVLMVIGVRLEQETVECLMKVRGRLILVLMRFHQFYLSHLTGNMRRVKMSRQMNVKGRVL